MTNEALKGLRISLDEAESQKLIDFLAATDEPAAVTLCLSDGHSGHGLYVWETSRAEDGGTFIAAAPAAPHAGVPAEPLYANSFGYSLTAEVLQSPTYHQLSDRARAECDELLARGLDRNACAAAPAAVARCPKCGAGNLVLECDCGHRWEGAAEHAYESGWRTAANWMERDDLVADIGSPAYEADMRAALSASPAPAAVQEGAAAVLPVAYLRTITHPDWLEVCSKDSPGAFAVYAETQAEPAADSDALTAAAMMGSANSRAVLRQALEALESILDITNEEHFIRSPTDRLCEIRGYARLALKKSGKA